MRNPPRGEARIAGFHEKSYDSEELEQLPEWWRRNVQLFRDYGLRPYRPSKFIDGTVVPTLRRKLEREYDIDIQISSVNPQEETKATISIDDEPIVTVGYTRESGGYTMYHISGEDFERIVTEHVRDS